ncbi:MAG: DUF2809 domain-containing protein [Cellulosilyticaceae bacterium]
MRKRSVYLLLTVVVMLLGLLSRRVEGLPLWIETYSGDTLWALMVFLGLAFLLAKQPTWVIGVCALIFAYGIEISQLYHAPWIDAIRSTTLGGLVLGYGFLWQDLICYGVGIAVGIVLDYLFKKLT